MRVQTEGVCKEWGEGYSQLQGDGHMLYDSYNRYRGVKTAGFLDCNVSDLSRISHSTVHRWPTGSETICVYFDPLVLSVIKNEAKNDSL